MICLGAVSGLALSLPTGVALAQSSLPAVTVDAPQERARPSAARPSRRAATTRAARVNRAARAPQAAPAATASGAGAGERANGPVRGFVATRSGTATKTDTPIIETPQSISVVTADQIRNQGAASIGEALRYTAGVSGDVNGGSDTRFGGLQIRGFDMTMPGLYSMVCGCRPATTYISTVSIHTVPSAWRSSRGRRRRCMAAAAPAASSITSPSCRPRNSSAKSRSRAAASTAIRASSTWAAPPTRKAPCCGG